MTAISDPEAPHRTARMPWAFRSWTIFAANAVCLIVNWWAANAESHRRMQFANTCGKNVGMTGSVTAAVIVIFVLTALGIVLTIASCVLKRRAGNRWGPIIGTALFLVALAALNMVLAGGDISYLSFHFTCSGV